jgi:hypothetical protein
MGSTPLCSEASTFKAGTIDQLFYLRFFVVFLKPSRQMLGSYLKSSGDCFLPQPFLVNSLLVNHCPGWCCIVWSTDSKSVLEKEISILYFILYSRCAQIFQKSRSHRNLPSNKQVCEASSILGPTSVKCHRIKCNQLGNLARRIYVSALIQLLENLNSESLYDMCGNSDPWLPEA